MRESERYHLRLVVELREESMRHERLARKAEREGAPFRARLEWERSRMFLARRNRMIDAWL